MLNILALGENIKKYRMLMKLSQAQLGDKLFVSYQAISNWERGITPPDLDNLCKLSDIFGVSVDELLGSVGTVRERVMIGIDGGGTKTEFAIFTESGRVLKRLYLESSHPDSIGLEHSIEVLRSGIDKLLEYSPNVCAIFAGLAGVLNKNVANAEKIANALAKKYKNIKIVIESDILNVIYCASKKKNLISIICGTGSILFLRKDGQNHRFGGWGNLFDDVGSGYAIARDGIRAVIEEIDGMGEPTLITSLIEEASEDGSFSTVISNCYKHPKSYIASFAPLIFQAYREGDKVATEILENNAHGIAKLINSAMARHGEVKDVVACGGVFKNREVFEPMIQKYLSTPLNFIYPSLPPIYGACVGACIAMGIDADDEFQKKYEETYNALI